MAQQQTPTLFISAIEPSGDQHGAHLIEKAHKAIPNANFIGLAGPNMQAAGCHALGDMTGHAAMLTGIVGQVRRAWGLMKTCQDRFKEGGIDAVVLIDSPTFHLPLARRAKRAGLPVLYYIAPQLWAWGRHRMNQLRRYTDAVACILPFEEAFFRSTGVNAYFVGHPLLEELPNRRADASVVVAMRSAGSPFVALLPGSRRHVVKAVFKGQLEVAQGIARRLPGAAFGVSAANETCERAIQAELSSHRAALQTSVRPAARSQHGVPQKDNASRMEIPNRASPPPKRVTDPTSPGASIPVTPSEFKIDFHRGRQDELLTAADLALVASGTSTLEVAWHGKPMVVMYQSPRWLYHLVARWLMTTRHLSLPNIIAGEAVVPEFMPYYQSTQPILDAALQLLSDPEAAARQKAALAGVVDHLRQPASTDVVALLRDVMKSQRRDA